jgi:hypothetical protein
MERPGTGTHIDDRLDEALSESFPASDPPAVHSSDDPPRQAPLARRPTPRRKPSGALRSLSPRKGKRR